MLIKKKCGNVAQSVIFWFLSVFSYFAYGYEVVQSIVQGVFLVNNPTGIMYYLGLFVPFIPILGLMFWGYFILNEDNSGGAET